MKFDDMLKEMSSLYVKGVMPACPDKFGPVADGETYLCDIPEEIAHRIAYCYRSMEGHMNGLKSLVKDIAVEHDSITDAIKATIELAEKHERELYNTAQFCDIIMDAVWFDLTNYALDKGLIKNPGVGMGIRDGFKLVKRGKKASAPTND